MNKLGKNEIEQEIKELIKKKDYRGGNRQSIQNANKRKHVYCSDRTGKLAQQTKMD